MNYITIHEEYRHKHFQLPQVFFTNEKYIDMSNNAKIAWALLRDRSSLSRKNKWFDKGTGRIFFIFTNEELMKLLNIKSTATLSKVKKELEAAQLIQNERTGMNKPNKMYLLYPEIDDNDIEAIEAFESYHHDFETHESVVGQGDSKNEGPENSPQSLGRKGCLKNESSDVQKMNTSNTEYIDTRDTKDTRDTEKANMQDIQKINPTDEEKEQRKKEYMDDGFYSNVEKVPQEIADMLNVFSETTEQARERYDLIIKAKHSVEKEFGTVIWLENEPPELLREIIHAFSRAIRKIEKERTVMNPEGYIYRTIYDLLAAEMAARYRAGYQRNNNSNWLEE